MIGGTPPGLGTLLLRLIPLGSRRAEVEADLLELFGERLAVVCATRLRYYGDVLGLKKLGRLQSCTPPVPGSRGFSARSRSGPLTYALRLIRRSRRRRHREYRGLACGWRQHVSLQLLERRHVPTDWHRRSRVDCACHARVCRRFRNVVAVFGIPAASGRARRAYPRRLVSRRRLDRFVPDTETHTTTSVMFVTGGYLGAWNNRAARGRLLTPEDDTPGAAPVVVVSHNLWTRTLSSIRQSSDGPSG